MNKKFSIRPMNNRIIVKRDGFKYEGKIVIPQRAERKPTTGVVIAVGAEVTSVRVGDHIVFGLFSGCEMGFREPGSREVEYYLALSSDEVLGFIEGEAELVEQGA